MVSRLPLRNKRGEIIGAIAFALKNSLTDPDRSPNASTGCNRACPYGARTRRQSDVEVRRMENLIGFQSAHAAAETAGGKRARSIRRSCVGEQDRQGARGPFHSMPPSQRVDRPFVGINVAAIPETLLEAKFSALHPVHTRRQAVRRVPASSSLPTRAHCSLDEIGDLSPLQSKCCVYFSGTRIEPVGSNQVIKVDVRIIAAIQSTTPANGARRHVPIRSLLPAELSDPAAVVAGSQAGSGNLVSFFAEGWRSVDLPVREFCRQLLRMYGLRLAGDIRELSNVIEQIYVNVRTEGERITAEDLADILPTTVVVAFPQARRAHFAQAIEDLERSLIHSALKRTRGSKAQAARLLGLWYEFLCKIAKLNIPMWSKSI